MNKAYYIKFFLKNNIVAVVAFVAAVISCFLVFPDKQYADYFDVSLDYIFGRCEKPQGRLYDFQPKVWKDNKQMQDLIEMCFDPNSPANAQLKETLLRLMGEQQK